MLILNTNFVIPISTLLWLVNMGLIYFKYISTKLVKREVIMALDPQEDMVKKLRMKQKEISVSF